MILLYHAVNKTSGFFKIIYAESQAVLVFLLTDKIRLNYKQRMKSGAVLQVGKWCKYHVRAEHYVAYSEIAAFGKGMVKSIAHTENITLFYKIAFSVYVMERCTVKDNCKLEKITVLVHFERMLMMSVLHKKRKFAPTCEIFKIKS